MREILIAYRDATQAVVDLLAPGSKTVDTARLEMLLDVRDSLIATQPTLPNVRQDAELAALADEILRLDQLARDLVSRAMQQTQATINQMNNTSRKASRYEQAYAPDAYFIDKKK
ncbi:hypothetical protein JJB07_02625 [Tumebacillus sp. ITR2]|uniref:Flagellar protein FliT n=1 Tax=Tumebacillus amylolyticus TaxID=2801339 RepID=A0ABS1J5I1_9BACL|nr:hypothetical protein [Tumebacillus amylolyticus]MBL0385533.1 hypothetical protein [Tumebacillus amylolyticus]